MGRRMYQVTGRLHRRRAPELRKTDALKVLGRRAFVTAPRVFTQVDRITCSSRTCLLISTGRKGVIARLVECACARPCTQTTRLQPVASPPSLPHRINPGSTQRDGPSPRSPPAASPPRTGPSRGQRGLWDVSGTHNARKLSGVVARVLYLYCVDIARSGLSSAIVIAVDVGDLVWLTHDTHVQDPTEVHYGRM
ncbi:hypothetical protein GY45DRAFT_372062 [Cubamyces sp. BRFM 1775]|nr:hypothetical protein GY45DRAFT_372062 [Cubamyces sp. BRFM 1775]